MAHGLNVLLGGDGLIGKALARALEARGEKSVSLDLKRGFDLRVREPDAFPDDSYYWFLAWDVGGAKYLMDPSRQVGILESNLRLCGRVFDWLAARKARFTFIGTQMSTYPNAYGISKSVGEYWARQLPGALVCRLWNVYGAEEPSQRSHVVPDLVSQGRTGVVRLGTSGAERRQFISDDDCAQALIRQREIGQAIADITSGEWTPVREVARIVAELMGASLATSEAAGYESLVEPEARLQGWQPGETLRTGLGRVISSMRAAGWC